MRIKHTFIGIFGLFFLMSIVWACGEKKNLTDDELNFISKVKEFRLQKDSSFKYDKRSPIPKSERASFKGLHYFEPNTKLFILAKFKKYENPDTLKIYTTKTNDIRTMLRYGEFDFKIGGKDFALQGYVNVPIEEPLYVFLPFTDLTTAKESYSGGRYLDINLERGDNACVLDFNMAYNPYCAYNNKYSCPLVPQENFLNTKIFAGEKAFGSH